MVKPSWEHYLPKEGDQIIEIDPGMAFGTGTHETTGMCVALVEQYVKPGDAGDRRRHRHGHTGHRRGAHGRAGRAGHRPGRRWPCAWRGTTSCSTAWRTRSPPASGDLLEAVDEAADVVIANIIADVICMLAEPVKAHIKNERPVYLLGHRARAAGRGHFGAERGGLSGSGRAQSGRVGGHLRPQGVRMHRFCVPGSYAPGQELTLPPEEAAHALKVLRLREGDEVERV